MLEITRVANGNGGYMIKNNIEVEVKVKYIENGLSQAPLAETIGTTGQYVRGIIKSRMELRIRPLCKCLRLLGMILNCPT